MKRRSECYGYTFEEILSKEIYKRLSNKERIRFNLDTGKAEQSPEIASADGNYVNYGWHNVKCIDDRKRYPCLIIHDFIDTIIPKEIFDLGYDRMISKIRIGG